MQPVQSRSYASTLAHSPIAAIATTCVAASFFAIARACGKISPKTFYACLSGASLLNLAIVCVMWKRLKFEITLELTKLSSGNTYDAITLPVEQAGSLFLGRLPLLGDELPSYAEYISLVERSELEPTPLSTPMNIPERTLIETPDFEPLSIENLEKAIEEIHARMSQGKTVYVHCKAGRGRSAMAVIGYFMQHHRMFYGVALSYVKLHRPQINMNTAQEARMIEFGDILRKGTQASC